MRYYFNPKSLRFEQFQRNWRWWLSRLAVVTSGAIVLTAIAVWLTFSVFDSPKEKRLKNRLEQANLRITLLNTRLDRYEQTLKNLQERDARVYRSIFEADPLPQHIREAGFRSDIAPEPAGTPEEDILLNYAQQRTDAIARQLYIQSKSYDELFDHISHQKDMLLAIPAIQPVSNRDTTVQIASGFGYRIHPIYKTKRMHKGLDFQAQTGEPVHATGKGRVASVQSLKKGYGNHIIIDHGYKYRTLYAHLSKILVRTGQWVNRGDVIGEVGSTGTSTAPHLHYEVQKNGDRIDPVDFFFQDLSPSEYDRVVELASRQNQSFD